VKTLVLALGNPILSDDAAGWEVADRLAGRLPGAEYKVVKESGASLDLVPQLAGYDRLVVIDAIQLGTAPVGTLYRFTLADINSTIRASSAHDINFATALAMGRELGYEMPRQIKIYAVEVAELRRFAEDCTPAVHARLDPIADEILAELLA
jgi:hydrogenase maturation protease